MTVTVHHLNNSRSQRILWLLEELNTDYDIVPYQRDAETNLAPPELKQVHPLGKSPLIEDDGISIAESGAIIQYLCERHGGESWLPARDSEAHIRHLEWMQFGESSFFVPVMLKIYAGRLGDAAAPLMPRVDRTLNAIVTDLEQRGLLDDTLVLMMGEFGRSPVMTKTAGRGHWARVMSMVMAGGGAAMGSGTKAGVIKEKL